MKILNEIQSIFQEMKAVDPVILDLRRYKTYCSTMVIATGTSDRHVFSMGERIQEVLKDKYHEIPLGVEGERGSAWLLVDYGDIVVHLFQADTRHFYDLEGMWGYSHATGGNLIGAER